MHLNADDYVAFWLNEELVMDSNLLWHEGTKSTTINLRKRNILAAKARNAFVTAGRDRGFIASIELKEAGLTRNIVSNGNWLSYDQEPSSNWMQFDYDDRLWRSATVLGDVGISPWGMMSNIHSSAKWIWSYDYLVSGKREDTEPSWFRRKIFSSECPD